MLYLAGALVALAIFCLGAGVYLRCARDDYAFRLYVGAFFLSCAAILLAVPFIQFGNG